MLLTYAVGDVHGALHKLERLVTRCRDHADGRPARFVFLGDYIDRGPQSAGVIRYLIELEAQMPGDVVSLMGNHEEMLLSIIDGEVSADDWLPQGGSQTLESYGIEDVRDLPREHIDWLRALRLSYDDGRRFFVHAGVNPAVPLDAQNADDLLWIREPFLSDGRDYGRLRKRPPDRRHAGFPWRAPCRAACRPPRHRRCCYAPPPGFRPIRP